MFLDILELHKGLDHPKVLTPARPRIHTRLTMYYMSRNMTKPTNWVSAQRRLTQSGQPPSLIRVFSVRMKKPWILSYPFSAQRRLRSFWADCWFCHCRCSHYIRLLLYGIVSVDRVKRIWYLSPMRAAKVQASLHIRAVSPEPSLLAHRSSESRGTFRQKARSLARLNGWTCAVEICHDGMLEDTNSLDGAQCYSTITRRLAAEICFCFGRWKHAHMHLHKYDKSLWIYMSKFSELSFKIVSVDSSLRLIFSREGLGICHTCSF